MSRILHDAFDSSGASYDAALTLAATAGQEQAATVDEQPVVTGGGAGGPDYVRTSRTRTPARYRYLFTPEDLAPADIDARCVTEAAPQDAHVVALVHPAPTPARSHPAYVEPPPILAMISTTAHSIVTGRAAHDEVATLATDAGSALTLALVAHRTRARTALARRRVPRPAVPR